MEMTLCCFFIWIFSGQEQKGEKKKKTRGKIEPITSMSTRFGIKQTWVQILFPKLKTYNVRKPLKIPDSQFTHVGRSSPNSWKG